MIEPYYESENATLYNADSLSLLDNLPANITAVISDPPYGCKAVPKCGKWFRKGNKAKPQTYKAVANDDKPFDPLPVVSVAPICVLFGGNYFADKLPPASCWLVWDKRKGTTSNQLADCELAWTNLPGVSRLFSHRWMGMIKDSERNNGRRKSKRYHPTQKPVLLMLWVIRQCKLPPGSVIFDPYMGSGSTAVAAIIEGHSFIGCDLDTEYCEISKDRIKKATQEQRLMILDNVG